MAKYTIQHEGSSFVAWDQYSCLEDAIDASKNSSKHQDKYVKIREDRIGGYVGYFRNGEEVHHKSF